MHIFFRFQIRTRCTYFSQLTNEKVEFFGKQIKKTEHLPQTLLNFKNLFESSFTIFQNIYIISDENVLRFQYFLFLIFFLFLAVLLSIIFQLILKENFFGGISLWFATLKGVKNDTKNIISFFLLRLNLNPWKFVYALLETYLEMNIRLPNSDKERHSTVLTFYDTP